MSVFLSYDRRDANRASSIAAALENAGHAVWWDRHIKGGAQYSKEIERALKRADAVVVLWSIKSIDSAWVRDEATAARDSGRLVPVRLDESEPPLGFRQYQAIDLSRWKGGSHVAKLSELVGAIEALTGGSRSDVSAPPVIPGPPPAQQLLRLALAVVAIIATVVLFQVWRQRDSTPVVSIESADPTAEGRALARDLLVRLGNVQASRADAVQLVEQGAKGMPDLVIEVSGDVTGRTPSASLVLLRAKERKLLSSQEFAAIGATVDELRDSLAMSAARLLGCATEATARNGGLPQDLQKLYIDACARFGMLYGSEDIAVLLPQFQQVIDRQPKFAPAWKLLLLSKAFLHVTPTDQPKPSVRLLAEQIAQARRVDPEMPEIGIAEMQLLSITDFDGRMRRMNALAKRYPDNPFVLGAFAEELMLVGRMNEAVVNAERAAMLDPISPFVRSAHIRALAYSGRVPRAFQELEKAAPLALGAKTLIEPRFRINMRYGDPRTALDLLRTHGTSKQHEAFLLARIEPTGPNIDHAIAVSRTTAADMGFFGSHFEVLAAFGREDEIYQTLMKLPAAQINQGVIMTLFRPTLKSLRQDPRFMNVTARLGLLHYWRRSAQWPDFCSEADLPYDCKAVAAKFKT